MVLINVKVNNMEDYKWQLIYVHQQSPNVFTRQCIHVYNITIIGVHPQTARLHLLETGAAKGHDFDLAFLRGEQTLLSSSSNVLSGPANWNRVKNVTS